MSLLGIHALCCQFVELSSCNQLCGNTVNRLHHQIARVRKFLPGCSVESLCTMSTNHHGRLLCEAVTSAVNGVYLVSCKLCQALYKSRLV